MGGYGGGGGYTGPSAQELAEQQRAKDREALNQKKEQMRKNNAAAWSQGRNMSLMSGTPIDERQRKSLLGGRA